MGNWYFKSMPSIKQINLRSITDELSKLNGVTDLFVMGEYLDNKSHPNSVIQNVELVAKTKFESEDLSSIFDEKDFSPLKISEKLLEDEGFNKNAVIFTKKILSFNIIDPWCIAKNKDVFHWGSMVENKEDLIELKKEADDYATFVTGVKKENLKKYSQQIRDKWGLMYEHSIKKYLKGIPKGWYKLNYDENEILKKAKKL